MTEPDVALTDFAIALLCAVLATLIARWPAAAPRARRWWLVFFASIGVGALLGGLVHGFFNEPTSRGHGVLWPATLITLGVTSTAMWFVGSFAGVPGERGAWIRRAAVAALLVYVAVVLFVDQRFLVAIASYLPATVFLLVVLVVRQVRQPARPLLVAIAGLLLTFIAAAVQQLGIGIHPRYFNHNALYHVIQGVALVMLYVGGRWVAAHPPTTA